MTTTAEIYADKVIPACEKWLEERKAWRYALREKAIEKMMKRLLFKPKTKKEAGEVVDSGDGCFPPDHLWIGQYWDSQIENLLRAAKASKEHGTGILNVDESSINSLKEYF